MHFIEHIIHTTGFAKFRTLVVCVLSFSVGNVQLPCNIHISGLGQLGSSCPVIGNSLASQA